MNCKVCGKVLYAIEELNFNGYCAQCESRVYDAMVEAVDENMEEVD